MLAMALLCILDYPDMPIAHCLWLFEMQLMVVQCAHSVLLMLVLLCAEKAMKQLEETETELAVALREIYNDMDRCA